MQQYLIEAVDITKIFPGTIANDHICLKVRPGEIMGLVGENGAGKSTILKCLNGVYPHDTFDGQIFIEGKEVNFKNPLDAIEKGIGYVPQEINVLPDLNVAENIYMFDLTFGKKTFWVNRPALAKRCESFLKETKIDLDPDADVRKLSIGQQQMLMIARALATNPKILILDEPTTSLSNSDVQSLFKVVRALKEKGMAILFVTHKMAEIMELTDSLTVMRDGKNVGYYERKDYNEASIIHDMIGRDLSVMYPTRDVEIGEEMLRVENLSVPHPYVLDRYLAKDISFSVRKGEILGLAGLVGAGRSEIIMSIFGELPRSSGEIYVNGKKVHVTNPQAAMGNGIGLVTEDRKKYGLHFSWSIRKNIALSNMAKLLVGPFISGRKESAAAQVYYDKMHVKATSPKELVDALSGGNQQKVVIARTLNAEPDIIFLDEPTKGIDVGAKADIYEIVNEMAKEGKSIVFISSELPELMAMCDRFIVIAEGQIAGELSKAEATEDKIMELATKTFKIVSKEGE